ncbi:MAG: hypothetical protein BMS9Abin05_0173 [Rhodothermia bacterium]|nr:MAG: hypothetical protein BMS9Abin05_0173 [Rhodothermia bacterium]
MTQTRSKLRSLITSQVGKKLLTGITGLALVVFVLEHMLGNLQFFAGDDAYNAYAHFLISLGPVLWVVEITLLVFLLTHMGLGINIWISSRRARSSKYLKSQSVGEPSHQTMSSRSMLVTGLIIGIFLVIHLASFKYGAYYETTVNGTVMRDLARLMRLKFHNPAYAFGYPAVVLILALHLRHGIWSAFQSIGAMRPSISVPAYALSGIFGVGIGVGFLIVPIAIYFDWV